MGTDGMGKTYSNCCNNNRILDPTKVRPCLDARMLSPIVQLKRTVDELQRQGLLKNLGSVDMRRKEMSDSDSESSSARKPCLPRRGVMSGCSSSSGECPSETVAVEVADLYKIYCENLASL